ncbi:MAG: hypothetical protein K0M45_07195 [Candidatus Paracaedibacteraceae bacterium]|nr:hypothetical protein [Candidatus Paracaedibacteraceae bacterium]
MSYIKFAFGARFISLFYQEGGKSSSFRTLPLYLSLWCSTLTPTVAMEKDEADLENTPSQFSQQPEEGDKRPLEWTHIENGRAYPVEAQLIREELFYESISSQKEANLEALSPEEWVLFLEARIAHTQIVQMPIYGYDYNEKQYRIPSPHIDSSLPRFPCKINFSARHDNTSTHTTLISSKIYFIKEGQEEFCQEITKIIPHRMSNSRLDMWKSINSWHFNGKTLSHPIFITQQWECPAQISRVEGLGFKNTYSVTTYERPEEKGERLVGFFSESALLPELYEIFDKKMRSETPYVYSDGRTLFLTQLIKEEVWKRSNTLETFPITYVLATPMRLVLQNRIKFSRGLGDSFHSFIPEGLYEIEEPVTLRAVHKDLKLGENRFFLSSASEERLPIETVLFEANTPLSDSLNIIYTNHLVHPFLKSLSLKGRTLTIEDQISLASLANQLKQLETIDLADAAIDQPLTSDFKWACANRKLILTGTNLSNTDLDDLQKGGTTFITTLFDATLSNSGKGEWIPYGVKDWKLIEFDRPFQANRTLSSVASDHIFVPEDGFYAFMIHYRVKAQTTASAFKFGLSSNHSEIINLISKSLLANSEESNLLTGFIHASKNEKLSLNLFGELNLFYHPDDISFTLQQIKNLRFSHADCLSARLMNAPALDEPVEQKIETPTYAAAKFKIFEGKEERGEGAVIEADPSEVEATSEVSHTFLQIPKDGLYALQLQYHGSATAAQPTPFGFGLSRQSSLEPDLALDHVHLAAPKFHQQTFLSTLKPLQARTQIQLVYKGAPHTNIALNKLVLEISPVESFTGEVRPVITHVLETYLPEKQRTWVEAKNKSWMPLDFNRLDGNTLSLPQDKFSVPQDGLYFLSLTYHLKTQTGVSSRPSIGIAINNPETVDQRYATLHLLKDYTAHQTLRAILPLKKEDQVMAVIKGDDHSWIYPTSFKLEILQTE